MQSLLNLIIMCYGIGSLMAPRYLKDQMPNHPKLNKFANLNYSLAMGMFGLISFVMLLQWLNTHVKNLPILITIIIYAWISGSLLMTSLISKNNIVTRYIIDHPNMRIPALSIMFSYITLLLLLLID